MIIYLAYESFLTILNKKLEVSISQIWNQQEGLWLTFIHINHSRTR